MIDLPQALTAADLAELDRLHEREVDGTISQAEFVRARRLEGASEMEAQVCWAWRGQPVELGDVITGG